jgi:hypothetical protein
MSSPYRAPTRLQIPSLTRSPFHPLILILASPSIRCQRRHRSTKRAFSYAGGIVTIV